MQDYYHSLGVDRTASIQQIKAAYRKMAMKHHPDRGGSHAGMVRINEAWHVLSDPELRIQYDQQLHSGTVKQDDFAAARSRSQNYERSWTKFDSWLSSIGNDFKSAQYGTGAMLGMAMPTASGSVSAWMFIITGGLCGFLLWLAIFMSVANVWKQSKEPQRISSTNKFLSGVERDRKKQNRPNLLFHRLIMLTCVASVAGGAWAGKWTHQKFGSTIAVRTPSGSSPSPSKSQGSSPPGSQRESKPTQSSIGNAWICLCPNCKQKIRVPSVDKTLRIKCPKCQKQFDLSNKTNPKETRKTMKFPPSNASLTSLLRGLLIFEIVYGAIVVGIGFFESYIEGMFWAEMGLSQESGSSDMFILAIVAVSLVVVLPATIASWVGLFQHRNWARWLYLAVTAFTLLLVVFVGCFQWSYRWGLVTALESIGSVVGGTILAICFLSPLAASFGGEPEDEST